MSLGLNMGINVGYGNYGNYAGFGMNFGYNSANSMMGGMLYGNGFNMGGGYGLPNMMGGLGGYMGMNGSMSLPLYNYSLGNAWDTTLATNLGRRDPVYLDTNRDGQLNVEKRNVAFDMNGDGIMDRVSEWNVKDAQLVYDANGDGQINNGREMMNEVGLNGEQGKYKNGWDKAKDIFDTNKDGTIDAEELKKAGFWTDANGNGKVDEGELKSAAEMGIMGIDPSNGKFLQRDQIGNLNLNFGFGMGGYGMPNMGGMGGYNPYGSFNPYGNMMGNYGMSNMGNYGFNPYGSMNMYGNLGMYGGMNYGMQGMNPYGMMSQFGGLNINGNFNYASSLNSTSASTSVAASTGAQVDQNKLLGLRLVFNSKVNSHEISISRLDEPVAELKECGWDQATATNLARIRITEQKPLSVDVLVRAGIPQAEAQAYMQAF